MSDSPESTAPRVGLLHPGAMGASVGAALVGRGAVVRWVSHGRSAASRARAEEADLDEVSSLQALAGGCDWLISVCPPHGAEALAAAVADTDFQGTFLDANAIAPERIRRIEDLLSARGIRVIDGGIIGGPAWRPGTTRLYLSGTGAEEAAELFAGSPLGAIAIDGPVGRASALKLAYAAYTKGRAALVTLVGGLAHRAGVLSELQSEWAQSIPELCDAAPCTAARVTRKAWRFAGEMDEIADLCASLDIPDQFHRGAAALYGDLAIFKDAAELPTAEAVWDALGHGSDESRSQA